MRDVVIAGYLRTPFSRSKPTKPEVDWFHKLRADELLSLILPEVLGRAQVKAEDVEDLIIGSALGVGEQWTYGGRTPLFLSRLSERTPAKFMDQQCGSSMAALHTGYLEIAAGFADVVLVAGMEHMTRVPIGPSLYQSGLADVHPALFNDPRYAHWDMPVTMNMGLTAEKLFAQTGLARQDLDAWAVRSHKLAAKALDLGFFSGEILPVTAEQADGQVLSVASDQCIRPDASLESLGNLKPAFTEDGVITAGNSSPLNAGASCMLLMSRDAAEKRGIPARAAIRSLGFCGVDPTLMGIAPIHATERALKKAGVPASNVDYWEINEAFAVVVLHMIATLGLDPERVNVMGGALALGHAMGATGVRLVGTLSRILELNNASLGCAAACIGGGQGVATLVERLP